MLFSNKSKAVFNIQPSVSNIPTPNLYAAFATSYFLENFNIDSLYFNLSVVYIIA